MSFSSHHLHPASDAQLLISQSFLTCSQSLGLHCISASVEVGNAVFTASEALLSALTVLAATSKQQKAISAKASSSQPDTKQSRAKPLTAAAFAKMVALLPDQVTLSNCTQHVTACSEVPARLQLRSGSSEVSFQPTYCVKYTQGKAYIHLHQIINCSARV